MTERLAFCVEIDGFRSVVFAETAAKAKWIAVSSYWDAFGKTAGWPCDAVYRLPRYDNNPLRDGKRTPWTEDYVQDRQIGG